MTDEKQNDSTEQTDELRDLDMPEEQAEAVKGGGSWVFRAGDGSLVKGPGKGKVQDADMEI
jgi:hypothetical protein